MRHALRVTMACVRRDAIGFASYKLQSLVAFANLVGFLVVLYFVSQMMGRADIPMLRRYGSYFGFVVIGIAQGQYFSTAIGTFASSVRGAQYIGVMEALLVTQTRPTWVIAASAAWPFLFTTVRLGFILGLAVFAFDFPTHDINPIAALVTLLAAIAAYIPLGLLSAAMVVAYKVGSPIRSLMAGAGQLLGGVYFPVEVFPPSLQHAANILPITHANEALRGAFLRGTPLSQLTQELTFLVVFALVGMILGTGALTWSLSYARKQGTLGTY